MKEELLPLYEVLSLTCTLFFSHLLLLCVSIMVFRYCSCGICTKDHLVGEEKNKTFYVSHFIFKDRAVPFCVNSSQCSSFICNEHFV